MAQADPPLLDVRDLSVHYPGVVAVDRLSLEIKTGEVLGVLGESGCGKSSLATAILGLLPPGGEIAGGSVRFRGRELVGLGERELRHVRGAQISLVFQEPTLALHPTRRVGEQIVEVIRAHWTRQQGRWKKKRARELAQELLCEVGFKSEEAVYHAYSHQLSGGQRQRIVIAQALCCRPALVIADEPTASLDSTTQKQVLDLLLKLRRRFEVAFLYISHDPLVLAEMADRILVMYAGRRAEEGPKAEVLQEPLHPYTQGLLACLPRPEAALGERELPSLPGTAPVVRQSEPGSPGGGGRVGGSPGGGRVGGSPGGGRVGGCRFEPRCAQRMEHCRHQDPEETSPEPGRRVWCFRHSGPEQVHDG